MDFLAFLVHSLIKLHIKLHIPTENATKFEPPFFLIVRVMTSQKNNQKIKTYPLSDDTDRKPQTQISNVFFQCKLEHFTSLSRVRIGL